MLARAPLTYSQAPHSKDFGKLKLFLRICADNCLQPDNETISQMVEGRAQYLECIILQDGIRYVVPRYSDTHEESYHSSAYGGLFTCDCGSVHDEPSFAQPPQFRGTDLGEGWRLDDFHASPADENSFLSKPCSHTTVVKEVLCNQPPINDIGTQTEEVSWVGQSNQLQTVTQIPETHNFFYGIDPKIRFFTGEYKYGTPQGNITLNFVTQLDKAKKRIGPHLTYSINISEAGTSDSTQIDFDDKGKLSGISLMGTGLLDKEGAVPDWLYDDIGVFQVAGRKLRNNPKVKWLVERLFGIGWSDDSKLDTKATLQNLIRNIDSPEPVSPLKVLVFKNTVPCLSGA